VVAGVLPVLGPMRGPLSLPFCILRTILGLTAWVAD
jgi:hypothetical protein